MKLFLGSICLTVFSCAQLLAQPIINATDILPIVGETFVLRNFNPENVSTGKKGANVTWDYSFLSTTDGSTYLNVLDPDSTPKGNKFPDANLCIKDDSTYAYYRGNTSEFAFFGADVSNNLGIYTDPEEQIVFPVTYGDTNVDAFKGSINFKFPGFGTFPSKRTGKTVMKADGYGTLMIPGKTFTDVLRIEVVSDQADYVDLFIFDTTIVTEVRIYQWVKAGMHNPILSIVKTVSEIQPDTIYSGKYLNFAVGVEESFANLYNLELRSNFDQQIVNLIYKLPENEEIVIEIYNSVGMKVKEVYNGIQNYGDHNMNLDVSQFQTGMYLVYFNIGASKECLKFVVPN